MPVMKKAGHLRGKHSLGKGREMSVARAQAWGSWQEAESAWPRVWAKCPVPLLGAPGAPGELHSGKDWRQAPAWGCPSGG